MRGTRLNGKFYEDYCDKAVKDFIEKYINLPTFEGSETIKENTVYVFPTANEKPIKIIFEGEPLILEEFPIK